MTTHNTADAKAHLSQLLDAALKGEDVIVAPFGKPLVLLVPVGWARNPLDSEAVDPVTGRSYATSPRETRTER